MTFVNFPTAYFTLADKVLRAPTFVTRGMETRELLGVTFRVEKPTEIFELPKSRFRYLLAEILWYATGDYSIDWISKFSSFWATLTDPSGLICSNYGHLLFRDKKSFWTAYNALVADSGTRQAISHLNLPSHYFPENKDLPCTLSLQFLIRDSKLNLITTMRSNDIWLGLTYDFPNFVIFQQIMLMLLREHYPTLELGWYQHQTGSLHVYRRHYTALQNFLKTSPRNIGIQLKHSLIDLSGQPTPKTCTLAKSLFDESLTNAEIFSELFIEL